MNGYRHLNLLVDTGLYHALKTESQSRNCPISTIVRDAIKTFLENPKGKSFEGTENEG